ncbi:outer membrane beta-barrel protein [Lichenifustis flavocetrariae]|uniref:Outer membrane beta-barrel protein n=1 Tax=Lichenifustis flavocetrariae TaxID=2949735 RepID=A0AA42CGG1_9HYPH|nr:outer membrane beta-barrel protein [Lichenifustis flavocetrariae]MCW6506558.1 outer membrane beta-barrel protein [Lichenifustis flavocetrariae]
MPSAQEATEYLSPKIMADAHPRWRAADSQAGAAWGGFLAWPSLGVGALVDSNPSQAHGPHATTLGTRITPTVVVERESGVHATAFYGWADAQLYPARPDADQLDGRVGILHDWAVSRDLMVRLQGDLSQTRDRLDSREAVTGSSQGQPFQRRDATLAASVQKTFNHLFASVAGDVVHSSFAGGAVRTRDGAPGLSDQTAVEVKARAGYFLGPALFAFAEPAANWRTLDAVDDRSHGTRLVAGLGVDRIGLLGGDFYVGAQRQTFTRRPTNVTEPVFGGRLTWWPTAAWTVSITLDRRLDQAAVGTVGEPLGTPIDAVTETARLRFTPSRQWWGEAALFHVAVAYLGTTRRDQLVGVDATLAYLWRHDLDLTADLRLTHVESTLTIASYDRASATLGARYHY